MANVTCPSCGNADDLRGRRAADAVEVECGACGHTWQRDLTPTCTRCGSTDLVAVLKSTLEEAGRGEQRTPSGIREVYHCRDCGAGEATSESPIADPDWKRRSAGALKVARVQRGDDDAPAAMRPGATRRVDSAFGTFAPGHVIGDRWRLERLVRWSATGSLWLAQAVESDQQVLFKLVHPRLTSDTNLTVLYARAAHALTTVDHPHVLPILDVKVRDGQVLVVAPAIEGSVMTRDSRLSGASLVPFARGLAEALAVMHAHEVAHLDIRPQKILIDRAGHGRLIDLGSGRARAAHRTSVAGTDRMAFQAPEQVLSRSHTPAADVYSLGLTLWALAGGDLEQMGVNATAQASYRLTNNVPALDPDTTQLPASLTTAIGFATRRQVEQRPTAAGFAELLGGGAAPG